MKHAPCFMVLVPPLYFLGVWRICVVPTPGRYSRRLGRSGRMCRSTSARYHRGRGYGRWSAQPLSVGAGDYLMHRFVVTADGSVTTNTIKPNQVFGHDGLAPGNCRVTTSGAVGNEGVPTRSSRLGQPLGIWSRSRSWCAKRVRAQSRHRLLRGGGRACVMTGRVTTPHST